LINPRNESHSLWFLSSLHAASDASDDGQDSDEPEPSVDGFSVPRLEDGDAGGDPASGVAGMDVELE
jgi:hypothetical protein